METAKILTRLLGKQNLSQQESFELISSIMQGLISPVNIAAILIALEAKKPSIAEISGAVLALNHHSVKVHSQVQPLIDTCGTGGDQSRTFNISTISAIVAAASGAKVAKHGNRAASSNCGSADILEELGVKINLSPEKAAKCIDQIGIGFLFAPLFHPAMKNVAPIRKELGIKTIFNLLGPLSNPANVRRQVIGVSQADLCHKIALVVKNLGCDHVLIVHGQGLDEITLTGETLIYEVRNNIISKKTINPEDFGMSTCDLKELQSCDRAHNKEIILKILSGKESAPKLDIVLLNSAAALIVADLAVDFAEGIVKARQAIESGAALNKLQELITLSNSL